MYHDAVANVYWNGSTRSSPTCSCSCSTRTTGCSPSRTPSRSRSGPASCPDDGWDAALEQAFAGRPATAVSAIAITIGVDQRGKGLSRTMLDGMRKAVAARGLSDLVAPVRPSQKHVYPLTPMERYVEWRRDDGKLHDAWLRTHEQAGAELIGVAPTSMRISGSVCGLGELDGPAVPRTAAPTSFPARSSRSRSIASATRASTSSRTSGCTTASRREAARARRPARPGRRAGASRPLPGRAPRTAAPRRRRGAAAPPAAAGTTPRTATASAAARTAARATGSAPRAGRRSQRGHARQAHGRAEIEERLQRLRAERVSRSLLDPGDVRVDREHGLAVGLVADRGGRVGADARERRQVVRPAVRRDDLRRPVQADRAAVVAEPLPLPDHVGGRGCGERGRRRPALEPGEPAWDHALDLRLLQHHFRDEDRVRVAGLSARADRGRFG